MANENPTDVIAELEARQVELIQRIDHLNERIEAALLEFAPPKRDEAKAA